MNNVYFGFSRPCKSMIFSCILMWWMNKDYSHGYVRFESETIPGTVYQASHGMVHFISTDNFKKQNSIVKEYKIAISAEQKRQFLTRCIERAGNKYSYITLIKIFLHDVFKIDFTDSANEEVCSELQAELLNDCLQIKLNKPAFLCRPDDVDAKLQEIYGKTQ